MMHHPKDLLLYLGRLSFEECIAGAINFQDLTEEEKCFVEDYREQSILDKVMDFYGCLDADLCYGSLIGSNHDNS